MYSRHGLIHRAWTRQRLSFNCQVQEQSSKDATTNSLAPNSYSHTLRVSKRKGSHNLHPHRRPRSCGTPTRSHYPRGRITKDHHSPPPPTFDCIGDADPSARHITLLGTTEQRIVFAPVEIRNPASSSSASRSTSKAKTSGKESASNPKKGKKKTNIGTGGIEEVAGSLNVGVSNSPAVADRDPAAESGPSTRNKAAGKKKDTMTQDDDEMYATEEEDGAGEGGGDGTLEVNVGGGEDAGEGGEDTNAGLLSRKKRKPSRNDANKGKGAGSRSTQGPTTISTPMPATVSEPNTVEVTPLTGSDIPMAIDPALEALNVPESQSSPQASGSGTAI